jgi:uncharacterized protein YecT (DUF1311 family)
MSRDHCAQFIAFALAVVVGLAAAAPGQSTPAELPADCSAYTSVPLPAEAAGVAEPKSPPDCASYRSYRGIGRPVNYSDSRACAWRERLAQQADLGQNPNEPTAWVVGGPLILADIYFNGAGVKRNVPLALRFACEAEEAMARLAFPEIAKLSDSDRALGQFEFCDYAATTVTMTFCSGYEMQVEEDRRSRYFSKIRSSMPSEQQSAFDKLLAAQNAYIKAHRSEVDQGGTIRGIRTIGSIGILNDEFHTEIVHFERKKWPVLSGAQLKGADGMLRRQYEKTLQQLRDRPKDETWEGSVTASNLASVQGTWEAYRDAWEAFARLRYPTAADAIGAEIILERYRLLKTIN